MAAAKEISPENFLQSTAPYELIFHNLFSRAVVGLYQADAFGLCLGDDRPMCGHGTAAAPVVAVHPEDRESVACKWAEAMASGLEWSQEYRCLTEAGKLAWMHGTVRQLRDGNGAVIGYLGCNLDTTARKEALEELTRSEGRVHQAMEAASAGLWDLDVQTDHCYFSPYCFEMLGYQPDKLRCDMEEWISIMHPQDIENARRVKHDCIGNGAPSFELEFRMKTNEGDWRWFLCRGNSTGRDAQGKALRLVGTVVDISERKLMEHMLRMKHDLMNLIATTSPVGIIFVERDGRIGFANPRAEEILGIPKEEILRRGYNSPMWQITSHDGKPCAERELPLREVLETGQTLWNACFAIKRPDGRRALLSMNAAPFLNLEGQVGGTVVTLEDVTERKQHEQVLADSDWLLRETQRIAQLGTYVLDLPNDTWTCSSKLSEILGMDESITPNLMGHVEVVHPDFRRQFIDNYLASIVKSNHFEMEYKVVRGSDGTERWVAEFCEMNHDDAGNVTRVIGTVQDITERKAAEEAIRQLNDELDLRVIQRTSQLDAAKKEIESFSYSVSHDLRAPLRHINSYSAMLIEDFGKTLPGEARFYLDRICAASSRMGKLIDDLLRLTQVGRTGMKRESFDISLLAQEVADMLREAEPACTASFEITEGLWADGDSILVRMVLQNLLGNSLKYASQKGAARIEFGRTEVEGQPVFFVRDDGVGFDMAYAGNLFQPFQRLHGAEFEGTGIGLATVKRIIVRHGGSIWGEGKVNEGAAFYFTLSGGPKG